MMNPTLYRRHLRDRMSEARIPFHLWEGLVEYLSDRRPVGGFLTAVLSNDLTTACVRADPWVREHLVNVVLFLVNYASADAWGSEQKVAAWLASPEPVIPVTD